MKYQQTRLLIAVITVLTLGISVALAGAGPWDITVFDEQTPDRDFTIEKVSGNTYWDQNFDITTGLGGSTLQDVPHSGKKGWHVDGCATAVVGYGYYKISSSSGAFFFLDLTTDDPDFCGEIAVVFNLTNSFDGFECGAGTTGCSDIDDGETLEIWDIVANIDRELGSFKPTDPSGLSVTASGNPSRPVLSWTSSKPPYVNSTVGGSKHDVERKKNSGSWSKIKDNNIPVSYTDTQVITNGSSTFYYKVKGVNSDDTKHSTNFSNVDNISGDLGGAKIAIGGKKAQKIDELTVSNYPNPFNPETSITFSLPKEAIVKLVIIDIRGRQVALLANGRFSAGEHTIRWNGINQASGIYYYTLAVGNELAVGRMMLTK